MERETIDTFSMCCSKTYMAHTETHLALPVGAPLASFAATPFALRSTVTPLAALI